MFLFILESIGTSELLLIAVVALMFLGPRKMPEMAKKVAKMMSEFRNTTSEFKETWQREVKFEDEEKNFLSGGFLGDAVPRDEAGKAVDPASALTAPAIKEVDPSVFGVTPGQPDTSVTPANNTDSVATSSESGGSSALDKRNWL